jgi:cytidine deaminase
VSTSEISEPEIQAAIDAAREVRERAYAPYSKYKVGCAIVTDSGETFTGCNVENASYGLCCCAERGAISALVARSEQRRIRLVVVVTADGGSPCGSCRQVLHEFYAGENFPVISFATESCETLRWTIRELLPDAFVLD